MSDPRPPRIKSRQELKGYFSNGMLPDETRFADLIDAMVHRDDRQPAPAEPALVQPTAAPQDSGWQRAAGRYGLYMQTPQQDRLPPIDSKQLASVPADGEYYVIVSELKGCQAFEVVASADGASDSPFHSITHAVAVFSGTGYRSGIRQTSSYQGWNPRRKIRLRWFKEYGGYNLSLGTCKDFGMDDDGQPVQIRYHITRLW